MKKFLFFAFMVCAFLSCEPNEYPILVMEYSENVTDIDGNVYKTVRIGDQIWMAENLRVTHFNDGTEIPLAPKDYKTSTYPDSYKDGMYMFCRDTLDIEKCGLYYNWAAITGAENNESLRPSISDSSKNICPEGWRIPTRQDWEVLINQLGGRTLAGGYLKNSIDWFAPNEGVVEASKFAALPTAQYIDGFDPYGYYAMFATANENNAWTTEVIYVGYQTSEVIFLQNSKTAGISIRCIKDISK